jgi:uncharacterized protein (TIGR02246 family)
MSEFAETEAGIRQLHARYVDAVWRKDAQAFGECFLADGEWRIAGMVLQGRDAITATIARILGSANRILMTFQSPILALESAGRASARTYVTEQCSWADGRTNLNIGRYYDRFAFVDGQWRFEWRLFQALYTGPSDLTGQWFDEPDFGPPPGMPPLDTLPPPPRSLP